jgi:hypothetical protein
MIFGKWDERAAIARQDAAPARPANLVSSPANPVPNGGEVKKPQAIVVDRPAD